jgi:tripartite-type tricarboxylate transporter receptor subunit TctC
MTHLAFATRALLAVSAIALTAGAALAQASVEQFYKGKNINLTIPTSPGGINDISARLVSRHLGKFIPGNPQIVVQNVPGGGGLVALNKIYNTSERDGTQIAIIQRGTPQLAIQGEPNAKFDPMKLTWLGSLSSYTGDRYLLLANASHPAKTAADLLKPGVRLKVGGDQPGSTNLSFAMMAKEVLGLNIDIVRGYPGAAPMFLAMQSGELDSQVIGYNSVRAGQPHLWNTKALRALVQFGREDRLGGELADVPTGQELLKDPDKKALLAFAELPFQMALPFVAPPAMPEDRTKALKSAFMQMTKDQAFLADAEKVNVEISAIDGDAVLGVIGKMAATPKDVIAKYTDLDNANRK